MTKTQIVAHLSELPEDMLRNWVITFSNCHIALSAFESGPVTMVSLEQMAELVNLALEQKDLNHFSLYEDVTDEPIGI